MKFNPVLHAAGDAASNIPEIWHADSFMHSDVTPLVTHDSYISFALTYSG